MLTHARERLEDCQAKNSHSVPDLNAASSAVLQLRATINVWEGMKKLYVETK